METVIISLRESFGSKNKAIRFRIWLKVLQSVQKASEKVKHFVLSTNDICDYLKSLTQKFGPEAFKPLEKSVCGVKAQKLDIKGEKD
jgi:flagellar capping protein FliD